MEVSVCNGRVIKSCIDPITSLERAGIAIEMVNVGRAFFIPAPN